MSVVPLRRSLPRAAICAAAVVTTLAVGGGLTATRSQFVRGGSMSAVAESNDTAVPVLRLALGDSVDVVTQHSTVVLPPRGDPLRDPPFVVAGTPVAVEYTRPGAAIRFPTGLFTSVSVEYGHAVDLRISPHLHALTLDEALALARGLGALAERAGWRRAATYLPLEAVPAAVEAARHTVAGRAIGYEAPLARWGGQGGDTLTLSIRRQASAEAVREENALLGKHRPEVDHYLLNMQLENATISERYYRLTVAGRKGVNVTSRP